MKALEDLPDWRRFLFLNRFALLLASMTLLIIVTTVIGETGRLATPGVTRCLVSAAFGVVLLGAVNAVSESRHVQLFAILLVAPTVILHVVDLIFGRDETELGKVILSAAVLAYVILLILRHVFSTRTVTSDTIFAALCVYVMFGILWANLYTIVGALDPDAFILPDTLGKGEKLQFGDNHTVVAIYYSFVTMTTLGYGDVLPRSATARMLAVAASVSGQLYVAVLIARLVGMHVAVRTGSVSKD